MAKVRHNIVIEGLSGGLGDQLVIKMDKAGRTIVSTMPTFNENREFSPAQQAQQEAFREASAYAKDAKGEAVYQAKAEGKATSSYNEALADWFHAPEIKEIDVSAWTGEAGQAIRVKALDDVQVKKVTIVISDAQGVVLEQGEAEAVDGLWWSYTTSVSTTVNQARILATAQDLPGHVGSLSWD